MHSTLSIPFLLFALSVSAQSSSPASSAATPTPNTASGASGSGSVAPSQTGNLANLVNYLIPTASITSLSPAQSSKIASDAQVYFSQYTQSHPVAGLQGQIALDELGASTTPSGEQINSIAGLLGAAQTGLVNNPSGFISSVNAIISPFPFATDVQTYESGLINGMATVVANDLSLSAPAPSAASSSTSKAAAAPARPTGAIAGGMAAAAGLVGVALL